MDLMQYNFKDAKIMEYVREKSKNTKKGDMKISFTIPEEAKPIIKRWMGRNGKLDFGYKYSYPNFRNYVTKEIIRLGERLEVESHVVYYSARKSFVQHGFELGIPLETLEYCIGQSMKSNRPIFNYGHYELTISSSEGTKTIVTRNMDLIERLNSEIDKEKEEATAEAIGLVLESSL